MTPAAKTRILVADDEPNIRLMLRTVLGNDHCQVDEASHGEAPSPPGAGPRGVAVTH